MLYDRLEETERGIRKPRGFRADQEEDVLAATGIRYRNIPQRREFPNLHLSRI